MSRLCSFDLASDCLRCHFMETFENLTKCMYAVPVYTQDSVFCVYHYVSSHLFLKNKEQGTILYFMDLVCIPGRQAIIHNIVIVHHRDN